MSKNEGECIFNRQIICTDYELIHGGCRRCGWNPDVDEERRKQQRAQQTEESVWELAERIHNFRKARDDLRTAAALERRHYLQYGKGTGTADPEEK